MMLCVNVSVFELETHTEGEGREGANATVLIVQ